MTNPIALLDIRKLARRSGVKAIAVENFLGSVDRAFPYSCHAENARNDARVYKWNAATLNAILDGLKAMYRG